MALPPINRMFITAAWLESILYGINCVLFGMCIYILSNRKRKAHWIILPSCIFHISIATVHNFLCLFRSLQAFTNPAIISVSDGSILYLFRSTFLSFIMGILYVLNGLALNLMLIWRLYVVWHKKWILIVMIILQAAQTATTVTAWALILRSGQLFSHRVREFVNASFAFDLAITVGVTSGIVYRLWRAGRIVSDLTGRHNTYKAAIYTVMESGALYTSSIIVLSALVMSGNPGGIVALNVGIQIATLAPLLLIARIGLGLTYGEDTEFETLSIAGPTFARRVQANAFDESCSYPMDTMDSSSRSTRKMRVRVAPVSNGDLEERGEENHPSFYPRLRLVSDRPRYSTVVTLDPPLFNRHEILNSICVNQ
ncbi:hypothetical protein K503DRAFT_857749 [Rhizopogon vinicolor AM-OR11-026]|uniref:Uncharacterized protein n=1 Tax=Rhizopogon vinicolor AM-OR11-026 TaxID=1314800 RepID=A0A1B7MW40_9AGAM|nr:hypothetical protein K503DRAFT_857749 [Rhizopogon vinicolor AM-OR11-026]